jgi:alpha-D-ribose 1-methylphosphonate 5-triphosphate diphosphatase
MRALGGAIHVAADGGRLRADHFIHLRCEVSSPDCLESFVHFENDSRVRLASLMDHAPGQRQFASIEAYKGYYQGKRRMSDQLFTAFCERRMRDSATYAASHRAAISARCAERGISVASHDDATVEHVAEASAQGVRVAEFPTTTEAARASREAGMAILMGAPNVVRGAAIRAMSRPGLAGEPARHPRLTCAVQPDAGSVRLRWRRRAVAARGGRWSRRPAEAAPDDRGEIAPGKRADLVRVRSSGVPVVRLSRGNRI